MRRIIRIPSHGAGGRSFDMEAAGSWKGLVQGYLKVTVIIKTKKKERKEKSVMERRPGQLEGRSG